MFTEAQLERRRDQNRTAARLDARAVHPSIRSFVQALDRQRQGVERVPLLLAGREDLARAATALDEAEVAALAIAIEEPEAELGRFAAAARAVGVPVLRADPVLEEFQIFETRAAGADALLLPAQAIAGELLARLVATARATHMAALVVCATAADLARAGAAGAVGVVLPCAPGAALDAALLAAVPARTLVLACPAHGAVSGAPGIARAPVALLRGAADAWLDPSFAHHPDPAAALRDALRED